MFRGVATALITPFNENGIDYESFDNLVELQLKAGIDGLLFCGTTGEPSTMNDEEYRAVVKYAVDKVAGRATVIIGAGANCTANAVERAKYAESVGADMLLVVTPYYNKCTEDGLIAHYTAISDAVHTPIIAYNVPGRTGVNITAKACKRLSEIKNVVALKDAGGNISLTCETAVALNGVKDFTLLSGDDGLSIPMMSVGAKGLISVASNVIPEVVVNMVHSYLDGNTAHALEIFLKYRYFYEGLFAETSPSPIKYACYKAGLCKNILRLPLLPCSEKNMVLIDRLMSEIGV